ncbi:MAG: helix-turn-helix domain-containing protein, partial [Chromatiaceae bacterium]|nr:helix-turn-helix domain-containing protein [Chromatiaceae bacterium]MCF7997234.1 helix-turn-helix domain-containing protein [Chromatiaceae bacterium]
ARWLLRNSEPERPTLKLDVPKTVLASRLSIQPETWSRVTRRLIDKDVIAVASEWIEIRDREALQDYADEL